MIARSVPAKTLRLLAIGGGLCLSLACLRLVEARTAAGIEPRLEVNESTVFYPVYGRDREELMRSLRVPDTGHLAPHASHGLTRSDFRVDSEFVQDKVRCQVRQLTIWLDVRIDLPRWDSAAPVPAALREDWRLISERTARHERLHRRNALEAAEALQRTLQSHVPNASCADLSRAIRHETNRIRMRWQLRDSLLDQRDVLRLPARRVR